MRHFNIDYNSVDKSHFVTADPPGASAAVLTQTLWSGGFTTLLNLQIRFCCQQFFIGLYPI